MCDQADPVQCIEKLISSSKGLSALQSALRLDPSLEFLNISATKLLQYIQATELRLVCNGDFLRLVILRLVDPPMFWNAFVNAQKTARLGDDTLQCFSWLLLQLITLPADKAPAYYDVARDPKVQKTLLESSESGVRNNGQKIKHMMESFSHIESYHEGGPGGRHDNDFEDILKISILPTPDEIASKEPPFLRRATTIDECSELGRLKAHTDNQFRLLREDMLRDLREELQIATGIKRGRRRGLHAKDLVIDGVECEGREPWAVRFKCLNGLPQIPKGEPDQRKKFIVENRNFLRHQSAACLIADGQIAALVTVIRKEDLLAQSPPVLCLRLSGGESSTVTLSST